MIALPKRLFPVCVEGGTLFTSWSRIEKDGVLPALLSLCLINLRCGFSFCEKSTLIQFFHNDFGFPFSHDFLRWGLFEVVKPACCVYMNLLSRWKWFIIISFSGNGARQHQQKLKKQVFVCKEIFRSLYLIMFRHIITVAIYFTLQLMAFVICFALHLAFVVYCPSQPHDTCIQISDI